MDNTHVISMLPAFSPAFYPNLTGNAIVGSQFNTRSLKKSKINKLRRSKNTKLRHKLQSKLK